MSICSILVAAARTTVRGVQLCLTPAVHPLATLLDGTLLPIAFLVSSAERTFVLVPSRYHHILTPKIHEKDTDFYPRIHHRWLLHKDTVLRKNGNLLLHFQTWNNHSSICNPYSDKTVSWQVVLF